MESNHLKTILVAENDEDDVLLMQEAFASAEILNPVQIVKNGEEAIEYLSGAGEFSDRAKYPLPGLVLLDLQMPRKNGFEVLQWMRTQPVFKVLPVVVLTGLKDTLQIRRAYEMGADLLAKPTDFDHLVKLSRMIKSSWLATNK